MMAEPLRPTNRVPKCDVCRAKDSICQRKGKHYCSQCYDMMFGKGGAGIS